MASADKAPSLGLKVSEIKQSSDDIPTAKMRIIVSNEVNADIEDYQDKSDKLDDIQMYGDTTLHMYEGFTPEEIDNWKKLQSAITLGQVIIKKNEIVGC